MIFTVQDILNATEGRLLQGNRELRVQSVCIDSRAIHKNDLFIAIKGDNFDGHDFVKQVSAFGVKVILVHRPVKITDRTVAIVCVKDTTQALGQLAEFHRRRFDIPVIGITGSAGKTTTKDMITALLKTKFNVLANKGTQNNHIGVPLTLLKLTPSHDIAVIEMGTNQSGDILWLSKIVHPTMAVLTNIGESHLEKLKTLHGVFKEKVVLAKTVSSDGWIIYNADDALLKTIAQKKFSARRFSFSIHGSGDIQARSIKMSPPRGIDFKINQESFSLKTYSVDMIYNALAAIACARILKVSGSDIRRAIRNFQFEAGRLQMIKKNGPWIINDTYNANPVSVRAAIKTIDNHPARGQRILVCADMLELGLNARKWHQRIGLCVANSRVDVIVTIGQLSRWINLAALRAKPALMARHFTQIDEAKPFLNSLRQRGNVILVKGSRRMKMELIVDFLSRTK